MSRSSNNGSRPKLACEISADRVLAGRVSDGGGRSLEACASNELPTGSVVPDLIESNLRKPDGVFEVLRDTLTSLGGRSRDVIAVLPDAAVRAWSNAFREASAAPGYASLREQHGLYPFALTGSALDDYVQAQIKAYRQLADELGLRRWPTSR